ncbi:cyclic di-GMP phosphodiesterase response regulator RpfG [bacterium BMS3Abin14]|nr:cyclic di-GMP phosphodiesterase response regulator RpfG [bacterium BMS3Abin14]
MTQDVQDVAAIDRSRRTVKFLDNSVRNQALYSPSHFSLRAPVEKFLKLLDESFSLKEEVHIGVINGVLYLDDYLFYDSTSTSANLLRILEQFEIDALFFRKGVTAEEVVSLAGVMNVEGVGRDVFIELMGNERLTHIGLMTFSPGREGEIQVSNRFIESYRSAISHMHDFFSEVRRGGIPPMGEVEGIVGNFMDLLGADKKMLMLCSNLKGYDSYTYQHCVNVGIQALLLGDMEGLDERGLRLVTLAGLMHDVGKMMVPDEILKKPGGLTFREWEAIKEHPVHSANIVSRMGISDEVARAVEGHHMNLDGSGYPVRPAGIGPGPIARLIAVVDNYDAIMTVRSYKRPLSSGEALAELHRGIGSKHDPRHVDALMSMVGIYPPGSTVRLNTNEIGVVINPGRQGLPVIRLLLDEDRRPFKETMDVDLSGPESKGRIIAGVVNPVLYRSEASSLLS